MGVVYSEELRARAEAWLAWPLNDKRRHPGLVELGAIWAAINNVPPAECLQCKFSDKQRDVAAYVRDFTRHLHPELMSESTYTIAPAFAKEKFNHQDYAKTVTAENLTDADAEFFISKGYTDQFIKNAAEPKAAESKTDKPGGEQGKAAGADTKLQQKLTAEQEGHKETKAALKAEKKAHATTTAERDELNRQLTNANATIAKLQEQPAAPAGPAAEAEAPAAPEAH